MDFMIHLDGSRVYELPVEERDEVVKREHAHAHELMATGVLKHIWRMPGQRGNVGIWSAADADELEKVLASLPIRPYADIQVTPLATHPLTLEATDSRG
ncbi:muconolactone Delta-isomerase family protein [Streptomyces sp. TRM68367]|uniref:muconolactone Delta-isomerase family protein n=1 Tax=Streptomyces sp. TRM68367 TaxID=2758415 RepID=UPI00165A5B8D|nr:muconolactone Delta-isomerase family protein [Streptomyces sp. TRM68367]MBC9729146.1 muconolactone Delta-isomerase family protein [Streptomyces sp. TRM68367]